MELPTGKTLLLFDGYCHFCHRAVNLVLRFDHQKKFLFTPLSGTTGTYWQAKLSIPDRLDSIILIENGRYYSKAEAALKIAKKLGGIFHLAQVFYVLPKIYRDQIYDWIAKNRYRWFGKYNSCIIPGPEYKDRFI